MVNVGDVISARVVADLPGAQALATASHSIAASAGYPDGEKIPVEEMLTVIGRIAAAVDLPVSADLEAGCGDPGETVRRAIGLGVVGANLEDQMRPLADAVAAVEAVIKVAGSEGIDFVLNARTDAILKAGAPVVFVPGKFDADEVAALVAGIGAVALIAVPGSIALAQMQVL